MFSTINFLVHATTDTCHRSPTRIQNGGRCKKNSWQNKGIVYIKTSYKNVVACSNFSILEFPYIPRYVISGSYTVVCTI